VIQESDRYYLLEVLPHTGRYHQIRSQLSYIGSPIKGDIKYGYPRTNPNGSIQLHARRIEFIHPVSKEKITVTAPVPKDDVLWQSFETAKD
jgi:23S rRNA pseudouridine1911/1915/1917 synthase